MKRQISSHEKKAFLKWFLENHRLKKAEAKRIIEYIMNHRHIIENLHFTDKKIPNKRLILISSINSDEIGFIYYKNNRKYDDVSVAYADLVNHPGEAFFMSLQFHGRSNNHRYLNLINHDMLEGMLRAKKAEEILSNALETNREKILMLLIDKALDEKNEDLFKSLVDQLHSTKK